MLGLHRTKTPRHTCSHNCSVATHSLPNDVGETIPGAHPHRTIGNTREKTAGDWVTKQKDLQINDSMLTSLSL
jgi:hypothetical protein